MIGAKQMSNLNIMFRAVKTDLEKTVLLYFAPVVAVAKVVANAMRGDLTGKTEPPARHT
jgi:hypothetical protein